MHLYWYRSDNVLEVLGVQNAVTEEYLNDATVTVTVVDAQTDAPIAGQAWPLTLPHAPGSNGDYRATLVDTLAVSPQQTLVAKVTVDNGSGLQRYWEIPIRVVIGRA